MTGLSPYFKRCEREILSKNKYSIVMLKDFCILAMMLFVWSVSISAWPTFDSCLYAIRGNLMTGLLTNVLTILHTTISTRTVFCSRLNLIHNFDQNHNSKLIAFDPICERWARELAFSVCTLAMVQQNYNSSRYSCVVN